MNKSSGPNFSELVLNLKGSKSYDMIEKASGGEVSAKRLQKLVNNSFTRLPEPGLFKALSLAFNVSQRELVLAAARTLGIDVQDENPDDLLLVGAGKLPQENQDLLKTTSRELQRWMEKIASSENEPVADVHELFPVGDQRLAADKGDKGIDPEQLPED